VTSAVAGLAGSPFFSTIPSGGRRTCSFQSIVSRRSDRDLHARKRSDPSGSNPRHSCRTHAVSFHFLDFLGHLCFPSVLPSLFPLLRSTRSPLDVFFHLRALLLRRFFG